MHNWIAGQGEHLIVFPFQIFIIGLIADRKYQQFRPVLDAYVQEHYSVTFADMYVLTVQSSDV